MIVFLWKKSSKFCRLCAEKKGWRNANIFAVKIKNYPWLSLYFQIIFEVRPWIFRPFFYRKYEVVCFFALSYRFRKTTKLSSWKMPCKCRIFPKFHPLFVTSRPRKSFSNSYCQRGKYAGPPRHGVVFAVSQIDRLFACVFYSLAMDLKVARVIFTQYLTLIVLKLTVKIQTKWIEGMVLCSAQSILWFWSIKTIA